MPTRPDRLALARRHQEAGDLDRAEQLYREILQADPRSTAVWCALGALCQARERFAEAEDCFGHAVRLEPGNAELSRRLGDALLPQGKLDAAVAAYQDCLRLQPEQAEVLTNLGVALAELGKPDEAIACYRRALALRPDIPEIHHNLGNALHERGRLEEALPCLRQAVALRPDYAKALHNLGKTLTGLHRTEEAIATLRRALDLRPDFAEAWSGLGSALAVQGNGAEAIACYERALQLRPDFAEAHWNLGLALLLRGDFERGWPETEWLWRAKRPSPLAAFPQPLWDGSPLHGQTILLHTDQGQGDILQFVRYAALVKQRGGPKGGEPCGTPLPGAPARQVAGPPAPVTVLVQCHPALVSLLSRCPGVDRVVPKGTAPPPFAVHALLQCLPGLFGTTLATVPAEVPYVFVDPVRVEYWRGELRDRAGFRVGIAWQGNVKHRWDRHRSIPLGHFEPLARVAGVRLLSLQRGPGTEQLRTIAGCFPVAVPSWPEEDGGSFAETAAVMRNLDLVVTCDTAVAHLAGALAVPVWVALPFAPDWRWLRDREDSPWYPTMRLFRQTATGDWQAVFAQMTAELQRLTASRPGPVAIEVSVGELLDRIARLEVESARAGAGAAPQRTELARLVELRDRRVGRSAALEQLTADLQAVHDALARMEEELQACERAQDFGPRFLERARSAYRQHELRRALLSAANELPGAGIRSTR